MGRKAPCCGSGDLQAGATQGARWRRLRHRAQHEVEVLAGYGCAREDQPRLLALPRRPGLGAGRAEKKWVDARIDGDRPVRPHAVLTDGVLPGNLADRDHRGRGPGSVRYHPPLVSPPLAWMIGRKPAGGQVQDGDHEALLDPPRGHEARAVQQVALLCPEARARAGCEPPKRPGNAGWLRGDLGDLHVIASA